MRIKGLEIGLDKDVYEPREDSFLLLEVVEDFLRDNRVERVLDVGTGTGIQALVASRFCGDVLAVDINPRAIELAKKNAEMNEIKNVTFRVSDLFENVEGRFDMIIFNPPYLPVEDEIDGSEQWSAGKKLDVIRRFTRDVREFLKPKGKILMVISSLTGLEEVKKLFEKQDLKVKVVKTRKIPWEVLYVLEVKH